MLITWPHPYSDWRDQLDETEGTYRQIAKAISDRERLVLICYDASHLDHVYAQLESAGCNPEQCTLTIVPSNDTWVRDYGPLTTNKGLLDFRFTGWGGKYPHDKDDGIASQLHRQGIFGVTQLHRFEDILEGGGLDTDGMGSLLTTEHCLLNENRGGISREEMERKLEADLGVERVLWLTHGALEGDDTDSHVDMLARFCDAETIAYTACDEPGYSYYDELRAMERELQVFRAREDKPYTLVPLPWPEPKYDDGQRLPASYANFLIINGAVLVPTYDDPVDTVALEKLQTCFPDREVIGINCLPLIKQYGSLHCATMQIPANVPLHE